MGCSKGMTTHLDGHLLDVRGLLGSGPGHGKGLQDALGGCASCCSSCSILAGALVGGHVLEALKDRLDRRLRTQKQRTCKQKGEYESTVWRDGRWPIRTRICWQSLFTVMPSPFLRVDDEASAAIGIPCPSIP